MKQKRGLDRFTELIWGPFFEGEFGDIRGKKILDMGCGEGRYTKNLIKDNEYHGVDIVRTSKTTYVCMAENTPYEDGYFDEVIALGLLDYSNPEKTLKEAFRVLKKGGNMRILVPNRECPYHMVTSCFGLRKDKRRFTPTEIKMLCRGAGFKIKYVFIKGACFYVPTSILQEMLMPVFGFFDALLGYELGNNIYVRAEKQ
jgi:ubiquinone/menaquinone biosynthesis C-methylase UbiE